MIDYNQDAEITQNFFKTVQNKLHWAVTGKTAAQIIAERAKSTDLIWAYQPGKICKNEIKKGKDLKSLEKINQKIGV